MRMEYKRNINLILYSCPNPFLFHYRSLIREIKSSSVKQALVANYDETVRPRLFEGNIIWLIMLVHERVFPDIYFFS